MWSWNSDYACIIASKDLILEGAERTPILNDLIHFLWKYEKENWMQLQNEEGVGKL